MKIRMKETCRVSEDGHGLRRLVQGETYDVADTAARAAIRNGWAEEATEEKMAGEWHDAR